MKIALVVPGGVDRSGRERVIPALLELIQRLARRHTLHVIAVNQGADYTRYSLFGATVTNLGRAPIPAAGLNFVTRYRRLLKLLLNEGPFDVLHAIWANAFAVMAARRCGIPTVVSIGGGEFANLPEIGYGAQLNWRSRWSVDYAVRHAAWVTAGSRYALQQCGRTDAQWLPLGIDSAGFHCSIDRPTGPPWRLLQVASINRVKDQFVALRALRILVDRGLDVFFDIVGEDTLKGALQRFAADLGVATHVTFHGFRAHPDLDGFYRSAHLYVQSSRHESQGVSLLEAAASSLPIAGTSVGLVQELAPSAAISVPVADPVALARAMEMLLLNPELRLLLARNARTFAGIYNADWTCSRFEQLYGEICSYVASPTTDASGMHAGATPAASARS